MNVRFQTFIQEVDAYFDAHPEEKKDTYLQFCRHVVAYFRAQQGDLAALKNIDKNVVTLPDEYNSKAQSIANQSLNDFYLSMQCKIQFKDPFDNFSCLFTDVTDESNIQLIESLLPPSPIEDYTFTLRIELRRLYLLEHYEYDQKKDYDTQATYRENKLAWLIQGYWRNDNLPERDRNSLSLYSLISNTKCAATRNDIIDAIDEHICKLEHKTYDHRYETLLRDKWIRRVTELKNNAPMLTCEAPPVQVSANQPSITSQESSAGILIGVASVVALVAVVGVILYFTGVVTIPALLGTLVIACAAKATGAISASVGASIAGASTGATLGVGFGVLGILATGIMALASRFKRQTTPPVALPPSPPGGSFSTYAGPLRAISVSSPAPGRVSTLSVRDEDQKLEQQQPLLNHHTSSPHTHHHTSSPHTHHHTSSPHAFSGDLPNNAYARTGGPR